MSETENNHSSSEDRPLASSDNSNIKNNNITPNVDKKDKKSEVQQYYFPYVFPCTHCNQFPILAVNLPCSHMTLCNYCIQERKMCTVCFGTIMNYSPIIFYH